MVAARVTLRCDSLTTEQLLRGVLEHQRLVADAELPRGRLLRESRDAGGAPFVGRAPSGAWTLTSVPLRPEQAARLADIILRGADVASVPAGRWSSGELDLRVEGGFA